MTGELRVTAQGNSSLGPLATLNALRPTARDNLARLSAHLRGHNEPGPAASAIRGEVCGGRSRVGDDDLQRTIEGHPHLRIRQTGDRGHFQIE
jgi:hypothetical protein